MPRTTGTYRTLRTGDEAVRAFVPLPLPPSDPPLLVDDAIATRLAGAMAALSRLSVAGALVPSADWFLYGFVRKEAVISSRIEGTQATLRDVLNFEATHAADNPDDVMEVCNYVEALTYARRQLRRADGLPISTRLLCETHKRLMRGVRGRDKQPGELRRSQNWLGGTRPGNAVFVPPPPELVGDAMGALERWIHSQDTLPPLIRVGLAHVQFETIHPFLDGNGRIGRLLVALLLEQWKLLDQPLLYVSLALRRQQAVYYQRLTAVRAEGDWEGWISFFLDCVRESADDGVQVAQTLFGLLNGDRAALASHPAATVSAIRLFDSLPRQPVVTLNGAMDLLETSKPTASKAIKSLVQAGILRETTGRQRDQVFAYHRYLLALTGDSDG